MPPVIIEFDERSAEAIAKLLDQHLVKITEVDEAGAMLEAVWAVHLIGQLRSGRLSSLHQDAHDQAMIEARRLLTSDAFARATASRRLSWRGALVCSRAHSPGGRRADRDQPNGTAGP